MLIRAEVEGQVRDVGARRECVRGERYRYMSDRVFGSALVMAPWMLHVVDRGLAAQ